MEVIEETFIAGRFSFAPDVLDGGVLLLETWNREDPGPRSDVNTWDGTIDGHARRHA